MLMLNINSSNNLEDLGIGHKHKNGVIFRPIGKIHVLKLKCCAIQEIDLYLKFQTTVVYC